MEYLIHLLSLRVPRPKNKEKQKNQVEEGGDLGGGSPA
jgi:hypothetical protein